MRLLCFWFGATAAFLAGLADPASGYWIVFALALHQVVCIAVLRTQAFLLIHYVTVLIYFSIAPAMQIGSNVEFWDFGLIDSHAHRQALNLLLLYLAGIELASGLQAPKDRLPAERREAQSISDGATTAILITMAAALALLFVRPALNFVARGVVGQDDSRPFYVIILSTLPKTMILLGFSALAINALRARTLPSFGIAAIALAMAGVAGNPVNTPRQILLICLLPLFIHLLIFRRRMILAAFIFATIAGIGPLLNFISRGFLYDEEIASFPNSQDFDAMYVVAGLLERSPVPEPGYGRYLLSAISFVLPRDLKLFADFDPLSWPSVALNFSQSNLSLPPFTTAYLDFGYLGPLLLGVAVASLFRWADRHAIHGKSLSRSHLVALVLLCAYVPFSRGPILGWGPAAMCGLIAAVLLGGTIDFLAYRKRRVPMRLVQTL